MMKTFFLSAIVAVALWSGDGFSGNDAFAAGGVVISPGRSELISTSEDMSEVIVADPEIADVHVHSPRAISVIGKKNGRTNIRVFDAAGKLLREADVTVSYDLPAIRKALKTFLPNEPISLDVVSTNLALTGEVSSASASDQAVKIVSQFVDPEQLSKAGVAESEKPGILNLLKVISGQQIMLRVRVGEIQRTAIKQLGVNLSAIKDTGKTAFQIGTGGGISPFTLTGSQMNPFTLNPESRGIIGGRFTSGRTQIASIIEALEQNGLFKVLAEPNLVAVSGEKAEFLAGGEFPVPVPQGGSSDTITVEYRQFGVAVQFTPFVLSENRIRINVQPEVSELSDEGAVQLNGFSVPSLNTRRAKTTVELAPGESFMIAGLISDKMSSQVDQLPGLGEIPVLGALFRSAAFRRNETELVIAVTPYLVDPLKSSDIRLPTDNLQPASEMEMFFYGALGSLSGNASAISQKPNLEGPIGFMVD